jgi:hypothetical protein
MELYGGEERYRKFAELSQAVAKAADEKAKLTPEEYSLKFELILLSMKPLVSRCLVLNIGEFAAILRACSVLCTFPKGTKG